MFARSFIRLSVEVIKLRTTETPLPTWHSLYFQWSSHSRDEIADSPSPCTSGESDEEYTNIVSDRELEEMVEIQKENTMYDNLLKTLGSSSKSLASANKRRWLNAYSISYRSCLLYNNYFPRHKDRIDRKMVDLAREVAKVELPSYRQHFDVVVACDTDEDYDIEIDIPRVFIYFSNASEALLQRLSVVNGGQMKFYGRL